MFCTTCGAENRETAKFCAGCGVSLQRACAVCAHPLARGARFCDECGAAVGEPAADGSPDASATRKTITVLFADLVGSTSFQEGVDAEAVRTEMSAYQDAVRLVVEAHGGTVAKFIGDGVMALFGVPMVGEDDAERAVRAGMALHRSFEEISRRILSRHGAQVGLRVGVNTGEVVVADEDDDLFGDVLNTAARIEATCVPGRVLVGEQTWRATRSKVSYEAMGEVELRGKDQPVATFEVVGSEGSGEELVAPFVGRDVELSAVVAAADAAIRERTPKLVTVVGSPGVGKTRLVSEAQTVLASRAQVVDLRIDRTGGATFAPVGELVRRVVGLADDDGGLRERIAAWIGDDGDPETLAPLLATLVDVGSPRSTEESFFASRRLVEILTARRPLMLVIDDIQWAPKLFLDLVEHLAEWVEGPLLVVCLARPEIRELRPAMTESGRRVADVVALDGLSSTATSELASGLLGGAALPAALIDRLPETTEGNPLFVRELVRMLVEDRVIERYGDRWELVIDADAVEVPPTIQSLLAARIERMDAEERRLVEVASVLGSEFTLDALRTLTPPAARSSIEQVLDRLGRAEVLESTGLYSGDEPILRFHHVLIRDAAYRRILKLRRAELHVAAAKWATDASPRLDGAQHITVGHHYEQALLLSSQVGSPPQAVADWGQRAAVALGAAATDALSSDDLAAAADLSDRALAVLPPGGPDRSKLLLIACEARFASGDVREGELRLRELRRQAEGDERITAWADAFDGQLAWATDPDRLTQLEPVVAAAAERLAALGDDAGVAKSRLVRSLLLARLGRVGDCEHELDAALSAARAADDRRRITAVLAAAPLAALWGPSPVARAGGRCLDIIRLLRITSASPMVEATAVRCQAVLEAMRGRHDPARELVARARQTVEELGIRNGILETELFAGVIELAAGEPGAAEPHLRTAYQGLAQLGVDSDVGQAAVRLSEALLALGRVAEAADLADESARLAGQNLQVAILSRIAQAEIALARGDLVEAGRAAETAVASATDTDLTIDHARALVMLAKVRHHQGGTEAGELHRRASELFDAKGARPPLGHASGVTTVDGEGDGVTANTDDSEHRTRRSDFVLDNLATRWSIRGAVLVDAGRIDDGAAALNRPDFQAVDHRFAGYGEGLERQTAAIRARTEFGTSYSSEPVAVRGDRLALMAWRMVGPSGDESTTLVVCEVDETGLGVRNHLFDETDRPAAMHTLNEWFAESLSSVQARLVRATNEIATAMSERDRDRILACYHDDAVIVDRRAGTQNFGELDAAAYVDHMATAWRVTDEFRGEGTTVIHRLTDRGLVSESSMTDGGGNRWPLLGYRVFEDGLIIHHEFHDPEQLDVAIERFDDVCDRTERRRTSSVGREGAASAGRAGSDQTSAEAPPAVSVSLVVRRLRAGLAAIERRDWDGLRSLLRLDFVFIDHGTVGDARVQGADPAILRIRSTIDDLGVPVQTVLATRGERVALHRVDWASVDGSSGGVVVATRCDDGELIDRQEIFGVDSLGSAHATINRWFAETLTGPPLVMWEGSERFLAQQLTGDFATIRSGFTDRFAGVDRRVGGFGSIDADVWTDRQVSFAEVTHGFGNRVAHVHALDARGGVFEYELFDGLGNEWRFVATAVQRDDGGLLQCELFEPGDAAAAITRLEELAAGLRVRGALERFADELEGDGLPVELFTPDVLVADHRSGGLRWSTGPAEVRASWGESPRRIEFERGSNEVGLFRLTAGAVDELAVVTSSGDAIARIDRYSTEDRVAAEARTTELCAAHRDDGRTLAVRATEIGHDLALDSSRYRSEMLRPDFRAGTMRGKTGPYEYSREQFRSMVEEFHRLGFIGMEARHVATRGALLALTVTSMRTASGAVVEVLNLIEVDQSGTERRQWSFDTDQLDEAVALLDQWYLDSLPEPEAAVLRATLASTDAVSAHDAGALLSCFAPDALIIDRRPGPSNFGAIGREAWVERSAAAWSLSPSVRAFNTAVHRVAREGVVASTGLVDDDGNRWELVGVVLVADGRTTRIEFFDPDGLAEARLRFDELVSAPSDGHGDATHAATALVGRFLEAVIDADADVNRFVTEHFLWIDHGATGMTVMPLGSGRLGVVAEAVAVVEVFGVGRNSVVVAAVDDTEAVIVVTVSDGRVARVDSFDGRARGEATAAASLLSQLSPPESSSTVDRFLEVFRTVAFGDDPRAVELLARPDIEVRTMRRSIGPLAYERDQFLATLDEFRRLGFLQFANDVVERSGDRLALARSTLRAQDGSTLELLHVIEVDHAGVERRRCSFDADQIDDALELLGAWSGDRSEQVS